MVWILRKAKKRLFRHDEGRPNGKFDLDLLERFVQSMLNRLAHLRHDESRDPDAAMRQALGSTIHDSFLGFTEAGGRSGADFDAVLCFASFFVGQF